MKKILVYSAVIAGLSGCLAGGTPDHYTGKTDPAPLTVTNTKDVLEEITDVSEYQYSFLSAFGLGLDDSEKLSMSKGAARGLDPRASLSDGYASLGISATGGTADGACGGTLKMDISGSGTSAKSTLTLTDYCETSGAKETTTNGTLVMEASGTDATGTLKFTMDLSSTDGTNTASSAGDMTWLISSTGAVSITMNMTSHNSKDDVSVKVENYVYEFGLAPLTLSTSGKVFLSKHNGYVDITTPTKFTGEGFSFTAGEMVFEAGTAKATLKVSATANKCDLEIDEDGDGTAESTEVEDCSNYF